MDVQLLQTVPMDRVEQLLDDPGWCLQQKYDGQRCLIQCQGGQVVAQHRNGMPMDLGDLADALPTDRDYGFTALILLLVGCSKLLRTFSSGGGGVGRGGSFRGNTGGYSPAGDDGW